MNSAAAMAERRCGRLKCGSDFALTFGGVGHFQRNPGKAFSTRQARRAPAPVGEVGRRWSGRPQRTRLPTVRLCPIGEGVGPPLLYTRQPKSAVSASTALYANSSSSCAGLTRQNVLKDLNDSQSAV
jgi:hypothetical protein